ncbi:hypothetical protein TRIUR3_05323 [Triticum urartu]|uniref:DUF3615 domain-containing protein n=1 Tax=Triticum urartu TaxID=4572 RepID=M7Z369_TRIUA|nr:hypothetical protein TRIUR3_05323 [Triticum urartu]
MASSWPAMVPEHVEEVSSRELGDTSKDLSRFETLTLNDTPHTLESADGVPEHVEEVSSRELGDTSKDLSRFETLTLNDTPHTLESADGLAQLLRIVNPTSSVFLEPGRKYLEDFIHSTIKGLDYEFDELVHQCLNVEDYLKIFHHFNFTVKIKKLGSADWMSVMYFAEVKSICMIKLYACYPLEQDQYGECYARENQGMGELRHPLKGIYDMGREDIQPPFYYEDSDSDEFNPATVRSLSSDDDMS